MKTEVEKFLFEMVKGELIISITSIICRIKNNVDGESFSVMTCVLVCNIVVF